MITVIRHQQTLNGFIQAVTDSSNERAYLQLYTVLPNGATTMDHEESWATEDGVISAFNESVKAHRGCDLISSINLPKDLPYVVELARHRADMWSDWAEHGQADLDCFYECEAQELGEMSDITNDAVTAVEDWLREVRS